MAIPTFDFSTAGQILFGVGEVQRIGVLGRHYGRCAFLVLGFESAKAEQLKQWLAENGVSSVSMVIKHEPTIQDIQDGLRQAEEKGCDLVIGFGGGSALDTAKAIAALRANPGDLVDYLEVIGKAQPLQRPGLPCIAIPTTAGTGSEVTRNAVIAVPSQRVKVSLRSPYLLPRLAIIDPELTLSLPPDLTASTGLDALTQVIEPFLSNKSNPLTDALCREGIQRSARSLRTAYFDGGNLAAREELCITSLFGGLALANAKLGAVHGFAGVIGGMFEAPHGAICARLLPIVMRTNYEALKKRQPESDILRRFDEVACLLTGNSNAQALEGIAWLETLIKDLSIPPLSAYGMRGVDIPEVAEKSARASSMKGNPIPLTTEELETILEQVL